MTAGSVTNLILDPLLIYGLHMGIRGAAAATVVSLCVNSLMYVYYLRRQKGVLKPSIRKITIKGAVYKEILKIGIPVLTFQLFASAALGLTNTAAKEYGLCSRSHGCSQPGHDGGYVCRLWLYEGISAVCRF